MKATPKTTSPRDYYDSPTTYLFGYDWIELPPNCRTGSFSKALTKAHTLPSAAVADFASRPRAEGDVLLRALHDGRWQMFQRRQVTGRRWSDAGHDSYAVKAPCGTGRMFIQ
ncbi:MAG: hypothetical protein A2Y76_01535 [Planctomycetes bacterium RBG_13_60_9]|nr:MAG: hypothetical protein A2Y76_01535 [Planctomycetes bacterium RBG_13_60_9]